MPLKKVAIVSQAHGTLAITQHSLNCDQHVVCCSFGFFAVCWLPHLTSAVQAPAQSFEGLCVMFVTICAAIKCARTVVAASSGWLSPLSSNNVCVLSTAQVPAQICKFSLSWT